MKGVKNCPRVFQDQSELFAWRDYLLGALLDGGISRAIYRRRIKQACEQFRQDSERREYYRRQEQKTQAAVPEQAKAAGAGQ